MLHSTASSRRDELPSDHPDRQPFISVVVPVRNEERHLRATLDALLVQDYPASRFEIVIVDGDSDDATSAIIAEYRGRSSAIRSLHNAKRLVAAARNIGVMAARGELIVIVDGHAVVDGPSWLATLATVFVQTGADCVGYPQPLALHGSAMQRAIALVRASVFGRHPASRNYTTRDGFGVAYGAAVAYRRSVFDVVGGWDERFDAVEDMELNYRVDLAGLRCFFTSAISVRYEARASSAALFRQLWRYGRGRVRLWRKHPATFTVTTFLPALLVIALVAAACLLPTRYVALAAGTYAVAIIIAAAVIAFRAPSLRLFPGMLLALGAIHTGAGCGALWELARGVPSGTAPPVEQRRPAQVRNRAAPSS